MIKNAIKTILLMLFVLLLTTGCDENKKYVVRDARLGQLTQLFKEYVGINGFKITYSSEEKTRSVYRIYAGYSNIIIPAKRTTSFSKKTIATKFGKSTRGRATTIESPAKSVDIEWYFVVYFTQNNGIVYVTTNASGGLFPNQYIVHLVAYFKDAGYIFEEVFDTSIAAQDS